MWMLIAKGVIAGAVVVGVTVLANRYPRWGAFLLTLPLVSILAFLSTWQQKHDLRSISHVARETLILTLQLEGADRGRAEQADLAIKVFELSQSLIDRWMGADYNAKRRILEMICLNFTLDGATLVPTMRSPFDLLIEGLKISSSRGDRI